MTTLFDYNISNPIILVCLSFVLGLIATLVTTKSTETTVNMRRSMIVLPPLVCAALLAVNGSIGTSIAIMGVFSLVRFRSVPGSAKDIIYIFLAMVIGLLSSTGYVVTTVALVLVAMAIIPISKCIIPENTGTYCLKILVPDTMNFGDVFEDILKQYFKSVKLIRVKTTNMGSLFELQYNVIPGNDLDIKKMMDEIRTHNGNLTVAYYQDQTEQTL